MKLSIPYRTAALEPRLGTPTSRANFCEEDYIVSPWIAEFVNTWTNLVYIAYGVYRLQHVASGPASLAAKMPYYALILVGVCSGLFHGTLKYQAQMCDDISMLVASTCVLHRALTFDRNARDSAVYSIVLLGALAAVSVYHVLSDERLVHELSFVVLIGLVAVQTRKLIRRQVSSHGPTRALTRDTVIGAACFGLGYLLWQLDFHYCSALTDLRRRLGMPLGFLLELHGWWHVLTAIGAHTFMLMVERLTVSVVNRSEDMQDQKVE